MKRNLRVVSLLLSVVLVVSVFASCKQNETEESTTVPTTQGEVVSTTGVANDAEKDTLIVNVYDLSSDYFPFEYKNGENLTGINIDLMNAVANKLNMNVEFVELDLSSSSQQLVDVHMCVADSDTSMFDVNKASFSEVYVTDTQSVIVKAAADYAIYDDFYSGFDADGYPVGVKDGIKIGVKTGTTGDIFASAGLKDWGFGAANVKKFATVTEMVTALKNDEITAIIIDDAIARKIIDSTGGYKILESSFYSEDYKVVAVCEDSEKQTKIINAVNELINDGTVKSIVEKYMTY